MSHQLGRLPSFFLTPVSWRILSSATHKSVILPAPGAPEAREARVARSPAPFHGGMLAGSSGSILSRSRSCSPAASRSCERRTDTSARTSTASGRDRRSVPPSPTPEEKRAAPRRQARTRPVASSMSRAPSKSSNGGSCDMERKTEARSNSCPRVSPQSSVSLRDRARQCGVVRKDCPENIGGDPNMIGTHKHACSPLQAEPYLLSNKKSAQGRRRSSPACDVRTVANSDAEAVHARELDFPAATTGCKDSGDRSVSGRKSGQGVARERSGSKRMPVTQAEKPTVTVATSTAASHRRSPPDHLATRGDNGREQVFLRGRWCSSAYGRRKGGARLAGAGAGAGAGVGGGGGGGGGSSSSDLGVRREWCSPSSSAASPIVVTDCLKVRLGELARKEREWSRERAELLTVIKLQQKQLTRSRECRHRKARSLHGKAGAPEGSAAAPSASKTSTHSGTVISGGRDGVSSRSGEAWVPSSSGSPQRPRCPPPSSQASPPPLLSASMLSVEAPATAGVHDHFLTAGSGSVAGTTNVSTSNEDAWSSVGAEEEDPFAFSSSERIELLCKVELQREEAAARSMGRTTPVGVFEASPRTEASKAGGETGMVSNGDQKDVEDGCGKPAARKGVKAREEIEGAIETLNSSTGEEGIENAESLDHVTVVSDVAFVEGRLETLEGHVAEVLRRLVALEEKAPPRNKPGKAEGCGKAKVDSQGATAGAGRQTR